MPLQHLIPALRSTGLTGALLGSLLATLPVHAQPMPPGGPRQADMALDAAQRLAVVDRLIRELNTSYVFPAKAKKVELALRQQQKRGAFDTITSAEKLAQTLTEVIEHETQDKHLRVNYSERPLPEHNADQKPSAEEQAEELAEMKARNFGVERIERLPFNIGYLSLRGFATAKDAARTLAATMTVLSNTDALIIDLRKNGGGDPHTVTLLASYFLDERTHLNDVYWRQGDRTEQLWSSDYVAGTKFGQAKDVYILTSQHTFSAAEDLSYTLQQLKRATIVGETTGGGAHPGDFVRLHAHFDAFVPNGRSINPITKTNWEGTGVTPNVSVPADDALKTAQVAVLTKMLAEKKDPRDIEAVQTRIAKVQSESTTPAAR